ncbi:hypothetical protein G6F24_015516 [Rhizopus arrhizus]|nr:hypothetical protein G6F24_015516 [Rhizopus arrhizus]
MRVIGKRCRQRAHHRSNPAIAGDHIVVAEDVQRCQGGRAGQRVAGVAVRMQERTLARVIKEGVVQRLCRQHRGQRQEAAGQALGQAHQVRHHPGLFAGEQRAGAAEARGDLIGNHERTVCVAQFAHALQVGRVMHAHAARTLQAWLQDHRADLARVLVEQRGQPVGGLPRTVGRALARLGQIGIGRGR